jgi:hypothetical protein
MNNLLTNYTTILNRARKKYNVDMIKYENKKRAYWKKITVTRYLKKTLYLGEFGGTNSNITRNWTRFTQYDGKKYWPLVQRWSRKDDRQSNKTGFESEYDTNEISQKRKKKNEIFVLVSKSVPKQQTDRVHTPSTGTYYYDNIKTKQFRIWSADYLMDVEAGPTLSGPFIAENQ